MNRFQRYIFFLSALYFVGCTPSFEVVEQRNEHARIFPEYEDLTIIPANIAPLNFEILEPANCFAVQIVANGIVKFSILNSQFSIPIKTWKKLLSTYTNDTLEIHIFSGNSYKTMTAHKPLRWIVSGDLIDPYVVYRLISIEGVSDETHQPMGIFERNVQTFDQRLLIDNRLTNGSCMNCHHFSRNRGSHFCMHIRKVHPGTLIVGDSTIMVNMSLPNGARGVFGNHSPSGRFLVFATNQLFCIQEMLSNRYISLPYDTASNLFVYNIQTNSVISSPELMARGFQKNYPCWSHDGKYLYFCQSNWQIPFASDSSTTFERIKNTHYALVRVAFDEESGTFGAVEIVVSSEDVGGRSISLPACSPDGRFISFSTTDFGTSHPTSASCRLWLYDLTTKTVREVEPNAEKPIVSSSEWSSCSRWIVAASRRLDGAFARPFFVHVDTHGNTSKLFALPQKDPSFYRRQDFSYGLPVLISEPVPMSAFEIADAVRTPVKRPIYIYQFDSITPAASAGHTD
jgi:hypothetical protein